MRRYRASLAMFVPQLLAEDAQKQSALRFATLPSKIHTYTHTEKERERERVYICVCVCVCVCARLCRCMSGQDGFVILTSIMPLSLAVATSLDRQSNWIWPKLSSRRVSNFLFTVMESSVHRRDTSRSPPQRKNSDSLIQAASRGSAVRSWWGKTYDRVLEVTAEKTVTRVPPLAGAMARMETLLGFHRSLMTGGSCTSKRCTAVPSGAQMEMRALLPDSAARARAEPSQFQAMAVTVEVRGMSSSVRSL